MAAACAPSPVFDCPPQQMQRANAQEDTQRQEEQQNLSQQHELPQAQQQDDQQHQLKALTQCNAEAAPRKQGWLHKLSYREKSWKKRYVEVTQDCELRYGRLLKTASGTSAFEVKGIISLDDAEGSERRGMPVEGHEDRFQFIIKVSSQRSVSIRHGQWWVQRDYFFAAVDEEEMNSWLDIMHRVRFESDVELVDRAYCLSGSELGSPRALDKQYTFIESQDLGMMSRQFAIQTHNSMANATRKVAEGVQTFFRNIVDGPVVVPATHRKGGGAARNPAWLVGIRYDCGPDSPRARSSQAISNKQAHADARRAFRLDLQSRLWFTYRNGFKPIAPTKLTSDTGWGCMLRSGQMILAQALLHHYLRRDWRLQFNRPPARKYVEILRWFEDDPNAMFSIHKIAQAGVQCNRNVGQWFGPDTVSKCLRFLWHTAYTNEGTGPCQTAGLLLVEDRCIYKDMAEEVASSRPAYPGLGQRMAQARQPCSWRSLVILVPVRLGVGSRINSDYIPRLAAYMKFPQSLGFIGGRPRHSYYFVGVQGYNTYYLDPHATQVYQSLRTSANISSFHCHSPEKMSLAHIDPSLALGFYCDDKSDFDDLCRRIAEVAKGDSNPILSVSERAPDYLTMEADLDEIADDLEYADSGLET